MTTIVTIDSTILGGLPCTIIGEIAPAEPDVGIFSEYVYDFEVQWPSGHTISEKVLCRVKESEWDRIREDILQAETER